MNEIVANRIAAPHGATAPSRCVLMIACAFPPTGGPGVQRSLKFVKYLPTCGWMPTVWASEPLPGLPEDASLLSDIPSEVIVHRARQDRAAQWTALIDRLSDAKAFSGVSMLDRGVAWVRAYRTRRLFPDDQTGWARRSLVPLTRLMRDAPIDLIYSTFSPASNHWLALQLKRRTGLPWVADFRDLWTDDYRYEEPSARRRVAHRSLENELLETADAVISVSDRQTELLARRISRSAAKFYTITNGFDPDDIPPDKDREPGHKPRVFDDSEPDAACFTIAHVGRLDRRRTPNAFFQGLVRFVRAHESEPGRMVFESVGHVSDTVVDRLRATGLSVRRVGAVSHGDAIARMQRADLLLLPVPQGPNADSVIPAKLFEYLATGRPILVIGPNGGEAARMVTRCRAGRAVGFDGASFARALSGFRDAWAAGRAPVGCAPDRLEPFNRIRLTQQLARVFDGLIERVSQRTTVETGVETGLSGQAAQTIGSSCSTMRHTPEVV